MPRPDVTAGVSAGPVHVRKAALFRALGNPLRIRVLELLAAEGELTVAQLLTETATEPSTLSSNLAVLRSVGVVLARRSGSNVSYRLADPSVAGFLRAAREFLLSSLHDDQQLRSHLESEMARERTAPDEPDRPR